MYGIQLFYIDEVTGRTSCAYFSSSDEVKLKENVDAIKIFLGERFKGYNKIYIKVI